MTDRQTRTIYIHEWDESFDVPVQDFVAQVQDLISTVLEEFRKDIVLEFDRYGGDHDYSRGEMSLHYTRPETDAEYEARKKQEAYSRKDREDQERRQLAALKAKYEPR